MTAARHPMPAAPQTHSAMTDGSLTQLALRRAMHEVLDGASPADAAARHGVPLQELQEGLRLLSAPRQGASMPRRSAAAQRRRLTIEQEGALHAIIRGSLPDAAGFTDRLWSREAVQALIARDLGLRLPERTLTTYLERWGFVPEKPLRSMAVRHGAVVRAWLRRDYPVISMVAREEGGALAWWGSTPLLARQQGRMAPGTRPGFVESELWEPGRYGLLFITGNRGGMRWLVHEGAPSANACIGLLERAVADDPRKLHLITPPHPVFQSPEFTAWALRNRHRFCLHAVVAS